MTSDVSEVGRDDSPLDSGQTTGTDVNDLLDTSGTQISTIETMRIDTTDKQTSLKTPTVVLFTWEGYPASKDTGVGRDGHNLGLEKRQTQPTTIFTSVDRGHQGFQGVV